MHPVLIRVPLPWGWGGGGGHFDIATYGVMMALATLFGVFAAWKLGKRDGVSSDTIVDVAFWGVIGGVLGAKVWYVLQYWPHYADKLDLLRSFRSWLVWYGGVIGGTAGMLGYLRWKKLPILKVLDIFAAAGVLGLAFGRVGCFFNGCCYGVQTDGPLGVSFARITRGDVITGSPAFLDQLGKGLVTAADTAALPVFPTQLFESVGALVIFAALIAARRWRRFYGEGLALLFVMYPPLRFALEFLRGDHDQRFLGMTASQLFSVIAFAAGLALFVALRKLKPPRLAATDYVR